MGKTLIWDLSHHQSSSQIDWVQAANEVALAIIRVQYGSNKIDKEYKNHVANCKKYGIPYGHYAYGCFVSVNDAKVEANDFYNRGDKDALFWVLDTEKDTVESCGTKNLAAASQAFIDTLKEKGCKTGFYVSHEMYNQYGLKGVKADFLWIPRYGADNGTPQKKPDYPCDLWQYSQYCKVSFYPGLVDLNLLNGDKSLEWFIDEITIAGKEEDIMSQTFEPSNKALSEAVKGVLYGFEQEDPALSNEWRWKFENKELSISDAIALLYLGYDRGYIPRN